MIAIGCKLPNGLLLRHGGEEHHLAGANSSRVIGGYGISQIPADFWAGWKTEYAKFPPLKNNLIFEQATVAKAEDQAKEQAGVKSGLEPLDQKKPAPGVTPA